jgi:SAM-dependent methyltransferase
LLPGLLHVSAMTEPVQPQTFDALLARRRLGRALSAADYPDFLHQRIADDLADRLDLVLKAFDRVLILADRPVDAVERLGRGKRLNNFFICGLNGPGADLVCSEELLPFGTETLDAVISVFNLHLVNDLPGALIQIRRALRPDGMFMASFLAGRTLHELRHAWLAAESELTGGATPRVAPFADIRDMGALLQRAGFALPVVDTDVVNVTYPDPLALMYELRQMGLSNSLTSRSRNVLRRDVLALACAIYEREFASENGRIAATFEIMTLTGWAPHASQQQPLRPGSGKMRLADALSTTEHPLKDD